MKIAFSGQGPMIPIVRQSQPRFGEGVEGNEGRGALNPTSAGKSGVLEERNALLRSIRNWGVGLGISILSVLGVNTAHTLHEAHLDRDVKAVERMAAAQQRQMLEALGPFFDQLMPQLEGAFPQGGPGRPDPLPPMVEPEPQGQKL